ncbi:MAG: putative selenocysteine system protein [Promethearchaeota archaeon]
MGLMQEFAKINKVWPNRSIKVPYESLDHVELFEIGYLAASDVPFQCFSIKLNPDNDHLKDIALLYNSATKQFVSLLTTSDGLALALFENDEGAISTNIETIKEKIVKYQKELLSKPVNLREQITKCILVERKVDEAMNFSLTNEVARRVYFAIGECRERAALIPIFQNSKGAELVQLALHKWMDFAMHLPQDQTFPSENTKNLIKNFLQIKKWLIDLIVNQLAGIDTLKKEQRVE